MAPLVRTGGSRHTGLAALPHRNIQEEAVKVIFIGHRPMNGRKALDSPGITGLVQK